MWRPALTLCQLLVAVQPLWAQKQVPVAAVAPQNCTSECIRQGTPKCEYCRVNADDIRKTSGLNSIHSFGGCIPWPCLESLGNEDPTICEHYVQAPNDVKVEFVNEPNPAYDTVVVSWKPSHFGIAFLRGFQVSVQALGGTAVACQSLLFNRNISLSASGAQTVYKSDPFPGLSLGSQYAVTVMALPVPEQWEKFYESLYFYTHSCTEKNGSEKCKQDWYPQHIEVKQDGTVVTVTFNLAPASFGIRKYSFLCYGDGKRNYKEIVPDSSKNKTHHTFQSSDLHEGTNYTCDIAAKQVDATRRRFKIYVAQKEIPPAAPPSLAVVLASSSAAAAIMGGLFALVCWRLQMHRKKVDVNSEIISLYDEKKKTQQEMVVLPADRPAPPRLSMCYSDSDGPAHVKAVMQLGAFIQQHMAARVCSDLWDSSNIAEEGRMSWYCRQIRESDFVSLICSPGIQRRHDRADPDVNPDASSCAAIVQLIGEEVGRAKARGEDMSKYMAAVFKYCKETDIPTESRSASHYMFPRDLPSLFSHLHGVASHRPGCYSKISNITEEGFTSVPAGAASQSAIQEAGMTSSEQNSERVAV